MARRSSQATLAYRPRMEPNRSSRPCSFFRCTWHIVRPANPPGSSGISVASNGLIKLQVINDRSLGKLLRCHFGRPTTSGSIEIRENFFQKHFTI